MVSRPLNPEKPVAEELVALIPLEESNCLAAMGREGKWVGCADASYM